MSTTQFSCKISANRESDISIKILLDQQKIFDSKIGNQITEINHEIDEIDRERILEIEMSGKTADDTRLDDDGKIVDDVTLLISDIEFDGINIDQLFYDTAEYHHDYNGTGNKTREKFYGTMGCNGTVSLKFSTPVYLWLLENM